MLKRLLSRLILGNVERRLAQLEERFIDVEARMFFRARGRR